MGTKLKEILISVDGYEERVAVLEDGTLNEIYLEKLKSPSSVGNIYLGKVKDVLPGMEAAFIDIGLKKNAFLYVEELIFPQEEVEAVSLKIQHLLQVGQEVLVQVVREPRGTKGARVTTQLALPGRYLVLLPYADFLGVSQRLSLEEREALRRLGLRFKPKKMGVILRTAAKGESFNTLRMELRKLLRTWKELQKKAKQAKAPALIHQEPDLSLRVTRDVFSADFDRLMVDSPFFYRKILLFLSGTAPSLKKKVSLYTEKLPLFEKLGLEPKIKEVFKRKVWLRSGGYITIDPTEALTAIDVNTGKYVGKTSLEETILKTNLEAAKEIARQIRLRDIGGIIVIDFIDMENPLNREEVYLTLTESLKEDRTKSRVIEVSRLGLVEMTRKSTSEGFLNYWGRVCPECQGRGLILSEETLSTWASREMRKVCLTAPEETFLFKVPPRLSSFLEKEEVLKRLEKETGKKIFALEEPKLNFGQCELVKKGSLEEIKNSLR